MNIFQLMDYVQEHGMNIRICTDVCSTFYRPISVEVISGRMHIKRIIPVYERDYLETIVLNMMSELEMAHEEAIEEMREAEREK